MPHNAIANALALHDSTRRPISLGAVALDAATAARVTGPAPDEAKFFIIFFCRSTAPAGA